MTSKRLDISVLRRHITSFENMRCEVDEPMSMPTLVRRNQSGLRGNPSSPSWSKTAAASSPKCPWSRGSSCMFAFFVWIAKRPVGGRPPPRSGVARAGRAHLAVAFVGEEGLHAAGRAMFRQLGLENLVDLGILVLVLDLPAALLDAAVGIPAVFARRRGEAEVAQAQRQITGARRAGIEVLMKAGVARHDHHAALLPVGLLQVGHV